MLYTSVLYAIHVCALCSITEKELDLAQLELVIATRRKRARVRALGLQVLQAFMDHVAIPSVQYEIVSQFVPGTCILLFGCFVRSCLGIHAFLIIPFR